MLTMIDDRTRGCSLGAVDYLTKPVDREQLNKALSRYYCAEEDICPVLLVEDDIENARRDGARPGKSRLDGIPASNSRRRWMSWPVFNPG